MQTYSTTQASNIAVLAGAIALVLSRFHVSIGSEDIQILLSAILIVGGVLVNWYQRYKRGDLTVGGFRK